MLSISVDFAKQCDSREMHRQLKSVLLAVEIILSLTTGSFFHVLVALPGQERLVWPSGGGDDEALIHFEPYMPCCHTIPCH